MQQQLRKMYISKYLVQYVPDARLQSKETAVRILRDRILLVINVLLFFRSVERSKGNNSKRERKRLEWEQKKREKEEESSCCRKEGFS